ncbi:hypothetical protein PAECIP112173_00906 [Paenibacillus sp. JJ-100]|uniref:putative PEP-binding protein n=1 Tax=Paenibacillus sp. JJ-100 TaxID=2974896 RepID=UPI0022FF79EC|nr:putative PEP-binding protein [Paenibacillus sp. JJ-100]CAI6038270.1 hypothetical protein PAECIP112173_00906 [Paenibacillus sp. JJ-100]
MTKRVMLLEEGMADQEELTHSIGNALAELMQAGWSVPAGMVVTSDGCDELCTRLGYLSNEIREELGIAIRRVEQATGAVFGDRNYPLLLHVRTNQTTTSIGVTMSAAESYTIPYVGLNDYTVEGFARQTGNRLYALQCYLTALQHYGHMVHGISYTATVHTGNEKSCTSTEEQLESLIADCKRWIQADGGEPFPQDVYLQLQAAIRAVFCSPRKLDHKANFDKEKEHKGEPVLILTAIEEEHRDSKGRVYTRNPVTGEKGMMGGELPAGSDEEKEKKKENALSLLKKNDAERYADLQQICDLLENRIGTVLEIAYVVTASSIWIQSIQPARLSPIAAVKSAVDFVNEGLIAKEDAILRMRSGDLKACMEQDSPELKRLLGWANEVKELTILAKVELAADAWQARSWEAEGIGLFTTETMLLSPSRTPFVQKMVASRTESERRRGIERLLPMQQADIEYLFETMDGRPVTIQLFDDSWLELVSDHMVFEQQGKHLRVVLSEIHEMQVEAIFRAAVKGIREGYWVRPEIMIPHVEHVHEMQKMRDMVDHVANQVLGEERRHCVYKVGAAITSPRASLTAAQLARHADFISFDTDELTQSMFGYTGQEAAEREQIFGNVFETETNPFQSLDIEGVGRLVEMAAVHSRTRKPHLKTTIFGEHTGDAESIAFIHEIGLSAVCCRPEQIPWVRVAAAQAVIRLSRTDANTKNEDVPTIA